MKPKVLIVDDKPNFLSLIAKVLKRDVEVVTARGVRQAITALAADPDAVVCDLRMPDGDGLQVLRALRSRASTAPFILMTAYATVPTAVQAMREGAYDYLTKPFDPDELRALVLRALAESAVLAGGDARPRTPGPAPATPGEPSQRPTQGGADRLGRIIGRSVPMTELYRMIERVAPTDATVLVTGETGVGKELVAQEIHERSLRASHRLVAINCAALPRALLESELFGYAKGSFTGANTDRAGLFEEASDSSLFLDEVGELRLTMQAKLTRVLEEKAVRRIGEPRERKVNVRLIAATHRQLPEMVKHHEFREDLWYRLNVYVVHVPALRERADDISMLAHHFLSAHASSGPRRFTPEAVSMLVAHHWPGNVRELRSAVERAAIVEEGREIRAESLPAEVRGDGARSGAHGRSVTDMTYKEVVDMARDDATRRYLEALLTKHRGNVTNAAAQAGMERESIHRLLRRHDVRADAYRDNAESSSDRADGDDDDA
ncbi:MAG: sigma-54 dependent transcriptional regulator [Deltaproteobacteria bacterium]